MERPRIETDSLVERRPGRPRSEASHQAILDAVIPLIQQVGYDNFTIEALAAHAGVGKATIYRRWASKEDLVAAGAARYVAAIPTPDTGGFRGDLEAWLASNAALFSDPQTPAFLSSVLAAMARSAPIAQAFRQGFIAARRDDLLTVLRRGQARGEVRADIDLPLAVDLCSGPFLNRVLVEGGTLDVPAVRRLADLLVRALGAALDPPTLPGA